MSRSVGSGKEAFQNEVEHGDEEGYSKQDDVQNKCPLPIDLGNFVLIHLQVQVVVSLLFKEIHHHLEIVTHIESILHLLLFNF